MALTKAEKVEWVQKKIIENVPVDKRDLQTVSDFVGTLLVENHADLSDETAVRSFVSTANAAEKTARGASIIAELNNDATLKTQVLDALRP